jgi:hypothetical protein
VDWDYDMMGRLTSEVRDVGNNGPDGSDYRHDFAYDDAGNRTSEKIDLGNNDVSSPDETINYAYDERDRLTFENSTENTHDVCYSYDPNGSLTQQITGLSGGTQTTVRYLWDLRNRLVAVDGNGDDLSINSTTGVTSGSVNDSSDTAYGYDNHGVRVSKTTPGTGGTTTVYLNDADNPTGYSNVLEEKTTGGSVNVTYVLGHDILGQVSSAGVFRYLLKDGHEITRMLSNADGTIAERYSTQAFGEAIDYDPRTAGTSFIQPDGATDVETSFTYSLFRYRKGFEFISSDDGRQGDASDPLSLHNYLYAGANPVMNADFSGHDFASLMTTIGTLARVGAGLLFGVVGAWNLAMAGMDIVNAYSSIGQEDGDYAILGWFALSILHTYTGLTNIQTANVLLFGTPSPNLPPIGLKSLRQAFAIAGDNAVAMGRTVWAVSPAIAGTLVNAAGAFLATNTFFATKLGNKSADASEYDIHHLLPKQFADGFKKAGLDPEEYTIPLLKSRHRLKPDGIHTGRFEDSWNGQWKKFFEKTENPDAKQILDQLAKMRRDFGI